MRWKTILQKSQDNYQKNKENQKYQQELRSNFSDISDITGIYESKKEIKEAAEYLFFERLEISGNEELAFNEAINYLVNKIVKQPHLNG